MQGRPVDGEAVAAELNSAAIHLLRGMRATDRQSGLSAARLSALSVLVFGGPCTMSQLARAEDVSAPTITRIVDALCELGHASRRPHPDNSRMVVVTATPAGEALMRAAASRRFSTIAAALTTLTHTDQATIARASTPLRRLADALTSRDAAPTTREAGSARRRH